MPPISNRTLALVYIAAALSGQVIYPSSPQLGVGLLGVALAALLMERWWYLIPLRTNWLSIVLLSLLGLAYLSDPRGWFFLAGGVIMLGTGLRADALHRKFYAAMAAQHAALEAQRAENTEEQPESDTLTEPETEPEQVALLPTRPAPPPPNLIPGLLFGLIAATAGALLWYSFVTWSRWQLDLLSWGLGFLVARAVVRGAGGSSRALQIGAGVLSGLGTLGAKYMMLRDLIPGAPSEAVKAAAIFMAAIKQPGTILSVWDLLFLIVAIWAGYTFAGRSDRE